MVIVLQIEIETERFKWKRQSKIVLTHIEQYEYEAIDTV